MSPSAFADEQIRHPAGATGPVPANGVAELEFEVDRDVADPWSEWELDLVVTDPAGRVRRIPAFWAGGRRWRARYASPDPGRHSYRVTSSAPCGLNEVSGMIDVVPYSGANPLLRHGALRVSDDRMHLAHADGTPFLWTADTWWTGMTAGMSWPEPFRRIADDRADKGFNVVQIVMGLPPEVVPFSPRMASEGGQPWEDLGRGPLNPAFFDVPDRKIDDLVARGIVPCIVGAWGFFAGILGPEGLRSHWRYLVARYGAYPVVWCLAGEANGAGVWEALARARETAEPSIVAPGVDRDEILDRLDPYRFDLSLWHTPQGEEAVRLLAANDAQSRMWEDTADYVGEIDAFGRVRTVHPAPMPGADGASSVIFESEESFDLDMLQTGHTGVACVEDTLGTLERAVARGTKPVINGECSYEGIFDANWADFQLFLFWSHLLSGAAGHTYGTMALGAFSGRDDPVEPLSEVSAHFWEDALEWRGAVYVGAGRRILERFDWSRLRPAPELIAHPAGPENRFLCYAATLPDGTVLVYRPNLVYLALGGLLSGDVAPGQRIGIAFAEPRDGAYAVEFVSPRDGTVSRRGARIERGSLAAAPTPTMEDWVAVLRPEPA